MEIRIYYEDTDAAGIVYHSNYLKYLERARTEYLRERGFIVAELAKNGMLFPVIKMEIAFKYPAFHDDLLCVKTIPVSISRSFFIFQQQLYRIIDDRLLVDAFVKLACVKPNLKPQRIPADLHLKLADEIFQLSA